MVLANQVLPELQGRVLLEPRWSLDSAKTIYFSIFSPFSFAWFVVKWTLTVTEVGVDCRQTIFVTCIPAKPA
jgi:hypothetical protein